jgi:hypothetical protein
VRLALLVQLVQLVKPALLVRLAQPVKVDQPE